MTPRSRGWRDADASRRAPAFQNAPEQAVWSFDEYEGKALFVGNTPLFLKEGELTMGRAVTVTEFAAVVDCRTERIPTWRQRFRVLTRDGMVLDYDHVLNRPWISHELPAGVQRTLWQQPGSAYVLLSDGSTIHVDCRETRPLLHRDQPIPISSIVRLPPGRLLPLAATARGDGVRWPDEFVAIALDGMAFRIQLDDGALTPLDRARVRRHWNGRRWSHTLFVEGRRGQQVEGAEPYQAEPDDRAQRLLRPHTIEYSVARLERSAYLESQLARDLLRFEVGAAHVLSSPRPFGESHRELNVVDRYQWTPPRLPSKRRLEVTPVAVHDLGEVLGASVFRPSSRELRAPQILTAVEYTRLARGRVMLLGENRVVEVDHGRHSGSLGGRDVAVSFPKWREGCDLDKYGGVDMSAALFDAAPFCSPGVIEPNRPLHFTIHEPSGDVRRSAPVGTRGVVFATATHGVAYGANTGHVFDTRDGGRTWHKVETTLRVPIPFVRCSDVACALGETTLLHWDHLEVPLTRSFAVDDPDLLRIELGCRERAGERRAYNADLLGWYERRARPLPRVETPQPSIGRVPALVVRGGNWRRAPRRFGGICQRSGTGRVRVQVGTDFPGRSGWVASLRMQRDDWCIAKLELSRTETLTAQNGRLQGRVTTPSNERVGVVCDLASRHERPRSE